MGLDITAYRHVSLAPVPGLNERSFCVRNISAFRSRAAPLRDDTWYRFEESMDFRAGSYSGYSQWRNDLARLAGYPPHPQAVQHHYAESAWEADGGPFWELINFADNEGVIGAIAAAKLALDFARYDAEAKAVSLWFYELYQG